MLGATLVVTLLSMTTYEIWRQRVTTVATAEQSLESLSLALSEQTERAFHSVALVLDATAQSVESAGGVTRSSTIELHRTLKACTTGVPVLIGLAIIDAQGHIVNSSRSFPPPDDIVSHREYFLHHANHADADMLIGIPVSSPLDGRLLIPVTRRISGRDGSFLGVVLAAVDPAYFQEVYARVLPDEAGAFALFRGDAILLARHPQADHSIGNRFAHMPMFADGMPAKGVAWGPSPIDGTVRIISYNRMSNYPLAINVSIDERILLQPWRGNALRLALAALLATVVLVVAVVVLVRQLERDQTQTAALRRSEQRLNFAQFALDHAADMVFWIDRDARILYANQMACDRLGYTVDEINGLEIALVDPGLTPDKWGTLLDELRREERRRFESTHHTRAGDRYPTEVSVNYVEFGGAGFVCSFVRDITVRKQAEAALAEKTASLEASNAELEQFAYVASHDLREPLRMVNSFVTLLARRFGDKLDDEAREYIGFAQEGAVRMDRLILDLLEYSRVGRLDRPFTVIPVGQVVEVAVKGLGLAADEAGAVIDIATDMPAVLANEEELVRLYLNLVGNALKYRHPDRPAKVSIGAQRQGNEVVCWVADNGIGIAPQYYERVFRIFQRLHGRDRYDGTGIGLAICKKIVERHGGRIWVESVPDQGSRFTFTLKAA